MKPTPKLRDFKCLLSGISLCLVISACASVPPDVFVFESLSHKIQLEQESDHFLMIPSPACMKAIQEPECGHGVSIVTGKEVFVGEDPSTYFNGKPWSVLRDQSILVPAVESYAPLATYMINACKEANCSDDVTRFKIKIESLDEIKRDVSADTPLDITRE